LAFPVLTAFGSQGLNRPGAPSRYASTPGSARTRDVTENRAAFGDCYDGLFGELAALPRHSFRRGPWEPAAPDSPPRLGGRGLPHLLRDVRGAWPVHVQSGGPATRGGSGAASRWMVREPARATCGRPWGYRRRRRGARSIWFGQWWFRAGHRADRGRSRNLSSSGGLACRAVRHVLLGGAGRPGVVEGVSAGWGGLVC